MPVSVTRRNTVYWYPMSSAGVSIPTWSLEGRGTKNTFYFFNWYWTLSKESWGASLEGEEGLKWKINIRKKSVQEEQMPRLLSTLSGQHVSYFGQKKVLYLSGERKQFLLLELPVIWSRSSLDSTTEKEMSKNRKPREAHQKDIWSCCP